MTRIFSKQKRPFSAVIGQTALILSAVTAVLYGTDLVPVFAVGALSSTLILKGLPILLLAIFAMVKSSRLDVAFITLGLLAHIAGDILITGDIPDLPGEKGFLTALYGFGLGHIFYGLAFATNLAPSHTLTSIRLTVAAVFWAMVGYGIYWFWPQILNLNLLILIYGGLLLLMATLAILSRYSLFMAGLGATLFLVSDALLGADMVLNLMVADYLWLVWPLYFTGQFLITLAVVLTPRYIPSRGGYRFA